MTGIQANVCQANRHAGYSVCLGCWITCLKRILCAMYIEKLDSVFQVDAGLIFDRDAVYNGGQECCIDCSQRFFLTSSSGMLDTTLPRVAGCSDCHGCWSTCLGAMLA